MLRGAGLPASFALQLAQPELAAAVDAQVDAERALDASRHALFEALRCAPTPTPQAIDALRRARKALRKNKTPLDTDLPGVAEREIAAFRGALAEVATATAAAAAAFEAAPARTAQVLRHIVAEPRLREAVTWQNRDAVRRALDPLAATSPDALPGFRDRQREDVAASYIHRYSMKNDTIGFFGPVGWARWGTSAQPLVARPGPELLDFRAVYFEQWAIDALGESLSKDTRIRPWVAPRRFGFVQLEGLLVKSPLSGRHDLDALEGAVLTACDGETSAAELARTLSVEPAAVYAALESLEKKQLLRWTLEAGARWMPERELRRRLERIGDDALRTEALGQLAELEACRDALAGAAGDAERVFAALAALEETFTRLTGAAASRNAGSTYAGRGLVFEDCRRDFEMTFGARIVDDLGAALALILTSARWVTAELARVYGLALRDLYETLAKKAGSRRIRFADLWFRTQRLLHGSTNRPLDGVARTLNDRWAEIVDGAGSNVLESRAIAPRVAAVFAANGPGWPSARHHSPDLMIGASSVEAVERGEYFAVLGEVHLALNTIDARFFVAMHPAPDVLTDAMAEDIPEARVVVTRSAYATRRGAFRTASTITAARDFELEPGIEAATLPRDQVLQLADLFVEDIDGLLVVQSGDRRVTLPVLDFFAQPLAEAAANALDFSSSAPHAPRITIDRLVVRRETWRFDSSAVPFAAATTEVERYAGARKWAREHGLPRFVFLRSPLEVKPIYVDFESPVAVRLAAKLIRHAKEDAGGARAITVTEMLPSVTDAWLPDASGERYTSEIRVVAVDQRAPSTQTMRSSDV